MSVSPPTVMLASVADVVAALRVELPAIIRAAVHAEMKRAELPPDVSPRRYSELSGLSPATVRRRIADRTIAAKKIGGRVLVSTANLATVDEVAIARAAARAVAG